ncbi:Nuclear envelope morphology protein 1 [Maudiozyma exigua]|uniref:Nuclear envelope morphology protein 1 n=1 Tax=Maudiozyma exigua TaxID=34358 RepID=A0A9P6W0F5_MAUEX|nr:Nuclear envelope morphology protein 1 [Kazachstania exigua]
MNALSYISENLIPIGLIPKVEGLVRKRKDKKRIDTNLQASLLTAKSNNNKVEEEPLPFKQNTLVIESSTPDIINNKTTSVEDHELYNGDKTSIIPRETMVKRLYHSKVIQFIWTLLIFLPTYLILKPLLLIWRIVSLPLTLIEHGIKLRNRPIMKPPIILSDDKILKPITEEDLSTGDEFIFQRDTIKGTFIKNNGKSNGINGTSSITSSPLSRYRSSTPNKHEKLDVLSDSTSTMSNTNTNNIFGSKKMGRFLFPKKLIPKSIKYSGHKKTLVIDLDETLIHSVSRGTTHINSSQGHIIEVKFSISGISTLYYVHKRPYCDLFLTKVSEWYNIVIFTASMKEYADPVIDWLETTLPNSTFSKRLYRNDCTLRDGVGYIKDLSILTKMNTSSRIPVQEVGLNEIIIIDNSPVSYAMNVDNAIQVEGWINDQSDTDLLNLIPLLESLRFTTDVRNILSLKNGEKSFISS